MPKYRFAVAKLKAMDSFRVLAIDTSTGKPVKVVALCPNEIAATYISQLLNEASEGDGDSWWRGDIH